MVRPLKRFRHGPLTNDFFVHLADMGIEWKPGAAVEDVFEGRDCRSGVVRWTGNRVDLVFGSDSQLRVLAEAHTRSDAREKLVRDWAAACLHPLSDGEWF